MWRQSTTIVEPNVPKGAVKTSLDQLKHGEVFAINAKSKKFAFKRYATEGEKIIAIVANQLESAEKIGAEIALSLSELGNRPVLSWGVLPMVAHQDEEQHEYEPFDRVVLLQEGDGKIIGTVIEMNDDKFPDRDIIILWDQMFHGKWVDECPIHSIQWNGEKANGDQMQIAKAIRPIVRELRDEHRKRQQPPIQTVQSSNEKEREDYRRQLTAGVQKEAESVAKRVLADHAHDVKMIVDACLLSVMAGEYNYQRDKMSEILASYLETMDMWIRPYSESAIVQSAAIQLIARRMQQLSDDGYFFIRKSYIKELPRGGFAVYSSDSELIGKYPTRIKAISQIKARERRQRYGYEDNA